MISGKNTLMYVHPDKSVHRNNLVLEYRRLERLLESELDYERRKRFFCIAEDLAREIDRLDDEFIASLPPPKTQ